MLSKSASKSMNQKIMIGIVIVIIVGTAACSSSGTQIPPTQTKLGSVFEIAPEEVPTFLEFIGTKGWYAHEIISVDNDTQTLVVRDGIDHEFTLDFDFADLHLKESITRMYNLP